MFLFYTIWGLFYFILNLSHTRLENFFLKNNPFLLRRRTFKFLSYFEKMFLILFYKKGWFENSLANLYRKKDISECRRDFYPIIYSFHIKVNKVFFTINDLKFFVNQYKYYLRNDIFKNELMFVFKNCFTLKKNFFLKYMMLQNLYINQFYNLNNYFYFIEANKINILKFNRVFFIFLLNSNKKMINFNLDIWYDWFNYNFNKNIIYLKKKKIVNKKLKNKIKEFRLNKIKYWKKVVLKYKIRLKKINFYLNKNTKYLINFKLNLNDFFKITITKEFKNIMKYYIIKFSESSITKFINTKNLKLNSIQYLRKNRIFNKGRYSRNRQLYRTGVYWCLWLNIIMVYGLYFIFYRFTFNFGYFWWGILVLAYSTIFSRILKYNFYNFKYLYIEFFNLLKWYGMLIYNCLNNSILFLNKYHLNYLKNNNLLKYKKLNNIFDFSFLISFLKNFLKNHKTSKINYLWQGMKEKDKSFFKYKTILHWFKQIYLLIIT